MDLENMRKGLGVLETLAEDAKLVSWERSSLVAELCRERSLAGAYIQAMSPAVCLAMIEHFRILDRFYAGTLEVMRTIKPDFKE